MENAIAWIFIFPLFGSVFVALSRYVNIKLAYPISVLSMAGAFWAGVETFATGDGIPKS
jgi:hypothetical protein